jgi:hypothetical protein
VFVAAVIGFAAEIEHIEQIANGRAVHRHIGIVFVGARIRRVVAAAGRSAELDGIFPLG